MPQEWSACTMVTLMSATFTVPPLFIEITFWRPFFSSQPANSGMATTSGTVFFTDLDGVADVVTVRMRAKHHVEALEGLLVLGAHGIVHHPRVDEDDFSAGGLNAEGRVAEPVEFDAFQVHKSSRQSPVVSLQLVVGPRWSVVGKLILHRCLPRLFGCGFQLTTSDWRLATDSKRFFCLVLGNSVTYVCRVEPENSSHSPTDCATGQGAGRGDHARFCRTNHYLCGRAQGGGDFPERSGAGSTTGLDLRLYRRLQLWEPTGSYARIAAWMGFDGRSEVDQGCRPVDGGKECDPGGRHSRHRTHPDVPEEVFAGAQTEHVQDRCAPR